jgi:two-component system sensor histidine kinase and response regulator WspE
MFELFRMDSESQTQALTAGLLGLERDPAAADQLEACMRAAHSLKGAASIVGLGAGVEVAHVMENCFVAAQQGRALLRAPQVDVLLRGVDLLARIARTPEGGAGQWGGGPLREELDALTTSLQDILEGREATVVPVEVARPGASAPTAEAGGDARRDDADRYLRVTAEHLNRLLALSGESLVESRWRNTFAASLLQLEDRHDDLARNLDQLRESSSLAPKDAEAMHRAVRDCREDLAERLVELDRFDRRAKDLSHRLYDEALACRMRPFADAIDAFPRLVRDVGRTLGKQVRLQVVGEATPIDRDVLEKLEAPLGHLLRNAVDHGIEPPLERQAAGKPAEGTVRLEARHSAGTLQVIVADDGRGVAPEGLRAAVVERGLTNAETAAALSGPELLEFLFLPGFTMKETVSEISGRGVGLDVVQDMVRQVRGLVRVSSQQGVGTRFQLQLPLTLSILRALLVEVGGEPFAFPLVSIVRTVRLAPERIERLEGREHFEFEGQHVSLLSAQQVFEGAEPLPSTEDLAIVVVGGPANRYGLAVDRFLGERELVVRPLDSRLGKIKDISAAALLEDGSPTLIVDVEDMILSLQKLASAGLLGKMRMAPAPAAEKARKRVLVVDDSLTVRELERKLLTRGGYEVEVAVDGMDGWNAVRTGRFDLVVTDIDMPRLDGIGLVTLIKKDPHLKSVPVMIVSYKDREEDRRRGLDAGADSYLTKGSFHDETLLQAAIDLVGESDR